MPDVINDRNAFGALQCERSRKALRFRLWFGIFVNGIFCGEKSIYLPFSEAHFKAVTWDTGLTKGTQVIATLQKL